MPVDEHDMPFGDEDELKLSFSSVTPVDVQVRNLSVKVEGTPQWKERFPSLRKNTSDLEAGRAKSLLTHIDIDFPRGTLTGVLGSSGSGKVREIVLITGRTLIRPSRRRCSMFCLNGCIVVTSLLKEIGFTTV